MPEGFFLSTLIDFEDDAARGLYRPENVEAMMAKLRDLGVRRVYWIHYGPEDDGFMWRKYVPELGRSVADTYTVLGDATQVAVAAAKRHGLEIYGVLKPYETGISMIYPEGSLEAQEYGVLPHLGSRIPIVMRFVAEHPEMRIRRRTDDIPPDLHRTPVHTIHLYKRNDMPTRIGKENLEIWTSDANYRYTRKDVDFSFADQVVPAPHDFIDMNGNVLARQGTLVRRLTLSGLSLLDKYILLTTNFQDGPADFENAALHMVKAFGPDGREMIISVGHGLSVWCSQKIDFRTWGIEYDNGFGRCVLHLDAPNTSPHSGPWSQGRAGFVAFTRGRNEYLPAALCAAYPEVQQFWLSQVQACLDAGVDGMDWRIENHCTHTDDFFAYGFNDVVIEEYRRRYGPSTSTKEIDLNLLGQIRGEYFTDFLRQATRLVHSYGKKTQIHLNVEFLRPDPRPSRHIAYPWNVRYDWRGWLQGGLFDEATLRTFQYTPEFVLGDPFSQEVIAACRQRGMPIHYNRYINGTPAHYADELEYIYKDGRFQSFIVYEVSAFMAPTEQGGVRTLGGWFDAIRNKAKALGIA